MSCGHPHQTPCDEVLGALMLFIDHEINNPQQAQAYEIHFQECSPCQGTMEQERQAIAMIQTLLGRSCADIAPDDLKARIAEQTEDLANQMNAFYQSQFIAQSQVYSEYTRTEITLDGVTQIIETSHEIRRDFPLE